jgi:hypothetical protein
MPLEGAQKPTLFVTDNDSIIANSIRDTGQKALFPRLRRHRFLCFCKVDILYIHVHKYRAGTPARSILMYFTYTPVLDNCSMHCSTFGAPNRCIHAVVRALLPSTYCYGRYVCLFCRRIKTDRKKISIFRDALEYQQGYDYHFERALDRQTSFDRFAYLPALANANLDFLPNINTPVKGLPVIRKIFPTHPPILILVPSGQDNRKHQCQTKESVAVDFIDKSADIPRIKAL